jgi:hypothetical protein
MDRICTENSLQRTALLSSCTENSRHAWKTPFSGLHFYRHARKTLFSGLYFYTVRKDWRNPVYLSMYSLLIKNELAIEVENYFSPLRATPFVTDD